MRDKTEEKRIERNQADEKYKKAMKKAKTVGWENYCNSIEKLDHVAKLQKLMKNGRVNRLGTLKRDDGTFTADEEETLQELVSVLFPRSGGYQGDIQTDFLRQYNEKLDELSNHVRNIQISILPITLYVIFLINYKNKKTL